MDETYVPGLNRENGRRSASEPTLMNVPEMRDAAPGAYAPRKDKEDTPVVGFLYSLSRGGEPEWWPLYIGQNKIGKDDEMDICLAEASITGHHANINIKRMRRSGNALAASIVDVGSKNGILLNDEELDYEPHSLKNEDIVIFGLNYKCVIILIDPTRYGLEVSEEFVPTAASKRMAADAPTDIASDMLGLPQMPANDPFEGFNDNATVNINGNGVDLSGGSTKIL